MWQRYFLSFFLWARPNIFFPPFVQNKLIVKTLFVFLLCLTLNFFSIHKKNRKKMYYVDSSQDRYVRYGDPNKRVKPRSFLFSHLNLIFSFLVLLRITRLKRAKIATLCSYFYEHHLPHRKLPKVTSYFSR